jgi:Tfp pilus assembly protein PilX
MRPFYTRLKNEQGSAMVFTLMVLVILTVVGIAASNRSNTELNVITDQLKYHRNFNLAEGAATEALDLLEEIANPRANPPDWVETVTNAMDDNNLNTYLARTVTDGAPFPRPATVDAAGTAFLGAYEGVADGHSLDMSKSTVHAYGLYGHSSREGSTTIKMGYRKAF